MADLQSAYKQLPRHPGHSSLSIVAVKEPASQTVQLFEAVSMMFGETAAVYGFLRFSRAIAAIATVLFQLVVIEFFDDFTQLEPSVTAQSAMDTMEAIIELLGWQLSKTEEKRKPFEAKFTSLGVSVELEEMLRGWITLANKEGRAASIIEAIEAIEKSGKLGFKDALSIRGKLAFAEGQHFGRIAAPATNLLSRWNFKRLLKEYEHRNVRISSDTSMRSE